MKSYAYDQDQKELKVELQPDPNKPFLGEVRELKVEDANKPSWVPKSEYWEGLRVQLRPDANKPFLGPYRGIDISSSWEGLHVRTDRERQSSYCRGA